MGADVVAGLAEALGCGEAVVGELGSGHARLTVPGPGGAFTVDVIGDLPAGRVAHLLPGGGLSVAANYCTAQGRSLARFLADHGYLVIGTTPREDLLAAGAAGPHCAGWGLDGHWADLTRVVAAAEAVTGLPYELFGHSAGAALALATAARSEVTGLRRVVVLDTTGPYDPVTEPESVARAEALAGQFQAQLDAGTWVLDPGLKALFARAAAEPAGPSGVPRPAGGPGQFSNLGLVHYALTHTRELPGPANWIYHRGHSSGSYTFGPGPGQDRFALDRTTVGVWAEAVGRCGSGLQPTALLRDLASVWAGGRLIDWAAIRAEVLWVNAELGRGDHPLGAELIRRGGSRVDCRVVPGYGHGDVVWGATAEADIWTSLLP
ncbi:thioesterase domain-containing protein [Kitasatospora sp. NPDC002227]|uniref:thioesterase domain-containing protein n=1 Tax=Kitasatospora sp. NPDC002227 TaxID=3154773 RepID=UPI003323E208